MPGGPAGEHTIPGSKPGAGFRPTVPPLVLELGAIRRGGRWFGKDGGPRGLGLQEHYKRLITILWPDYVWHRWNELLLQEFLANTITAILGPASSGKTNSSAVYALADYYAFPRETTVLCSSTSRDMLQLRVWGEIKKYHRLAKERHPELPGTLSDARLMLTTDGREVEGREFRDGLVGVACRVGGNYVGLVNYVGVKNKRVRLVADELQFMPRAFVDSINNLSANPDFKCVAMGNPKSTQDALGIIAEPHAELGGWESLGDTGKTRVWRTRFPGGRAVQLHGEDSPNLDHPAGAEPYPFLIGRRKLDEAAAFYGKGSLQYLMMNAGVMPTAESSRRVITRMLCERNRAMESVIWADSSKVTYLAACDAAYAAVGGDRTVVGQFAFGPDKDGTEVFALIGNLETLSPRALDPEPPEEQIAKSLRVFCEVRGISPDKLFFDGTGRSSLTSALGRLWSPLVVAIEFGGKASDRPLGPLKMASAKHRKFVSELWFASRYCVESTQMRGMTEALIEEGSMREWFVGKGAGGELYEDVEIKDITRERMGRSPDLYDTLVSGLEGARRLGFVIRPKFGKVEPTGGRSGLRTMADKFRRLTSARDLIYS